MKDFVSEFILIYVVLDLRKIFLLNMKYVLGF